VDQPTERDTHLREAEGGGAVEGPPRIPVGRYRLHYRAADPVRLPEYAGSTWRGALGHALKRTVCVTHEPRCPACLLYTSCAYSYVFETPPPPGTAKMRLYPAAPHPFVIEPAEGGARELALTWRDWTRYSSRQQTTMQMGGLTGRLGVDLGGHERLWPYLWLGQWTHAGKGTSMGLGRYRLATVARSA
jgi:hypothetical protein